jgi:superfamily II RNA helicase
VTSSLAARLPPGAVSPDELLEVFLGWTAEQGLTLYPAQEEAVLEVLSGGRHVILGTPTGSGKSLVALAVHLRALARIERSYYTAPLKALASEKFFALCRDLGPERVGMLTGDASVNPEAPVICCTAEVLANLALRQGASAEVDQVVMDEFHYYGDRDRGMAWQVPLLELPRATFLLMSATLGDTTALEKTLEERTGKPVRAIQSQDRPVPLAFSYADDPLHETLAGLVRDGRAPVYVVNTSQREAAEQAQALTSADLVGKETRRAIAEAIGGFRFDTAYGKDMNRLLRHGIGLHHAGLLPKYRLLVEQLAQRALLKIVCGTDTLGVGVNIPIRTVVFTKLCKFDGEKARLLQVREFLQVAGRAGRKGFDEQGWVVAQAPEHAIENRRLEAKARMSGKKRFTKKQPPDRGYVPYTKATFDTLCQGRPEPLQSVFKLDHGVLTNLLGRPDQPGQPGGYRAVVELIARCHEHPGRKRHLRREAAQLFKELHRAYLVDLVPAPSGRGQRVALAPDLQRDFSLHHTLSLYLVDALDHLDQRAEAYPLDVLSRVEAILEDPEPILWRQVDRAKGELIAELKAAGVEYEERMARLEAVTWPKPDAERIYATFNQFAERHPWLRHQHIRPKSIAREILEGYSTFNDYVKAYGLERVEGLCLRYLTQVYKTLVQNVPARFKPEGIQDLEASLRVLVSRVDSSLVAEWEQLREGTVPPGVEAPPPVPPAERLARDPKRLSARLRAELHRVVHALAQRDWEEAARSVRQDPADPWPAERFAAAMQSFFSSYERLCFDQRARLADKTLLTAAGRLRWEVTQVLCDPVEDDFWHLEGLVDLEAVTDLDAEPLVMLRNLGV